MQQNGAAFVAFVQPWFLNKMNSSRLSAKNRDEVLKTGLQLAKNRKCQTALSKIEKKMMKKFHS